jgi:hypothetical protein
VFFGGCGYALAAKFFGVIFPVEDVPLFAAFEDFFFLGSDALADFGFDFFLVAEDVGHGLDHVLTDGVAVLDEFDFVALHQKIDDLMGDADNFFAAQSHNSVGSCSLP